MGKLLPLGDRILVQVIEAEKVTRGGIHLPDTAQKSSRACRGKVLAVGPGRYDHERQTYNTLNVQEGWVVLYNEWAGHEVPDTDGKQRMLSESDVLGHYEQPSEPKPTNGPKQSNDPKQHATPRISGSYGGI